MSARLPLVVDRPGIVVPVPVDPTGLQGPTRGQARGRRWRRTGRNLQVPAWVDATVPEQRIVEALAGAPPGAAVTGWAARRWLRGEWCEGTTADGSPRPVPIALGDRRAVRPREGVELTEGWLLPGDVIVVDGLPVTTAVRAVAYEVITAPSLLAAVQAVDMAACSDLISLEELADYRTRLAYRPNVTRIDDALAWADENAWSPQEVRMRLEWADATGRPVAHNQPLFDLDGNHLLTPDLLDAELGVAGEYDGPVHAAPDVLRRTIDKEALYRRHGIELVTMVSPRVDDLASFRSRLRAAYDSARRRAGAVRTWTTEQPAWWVDTTTVAHRRALTPDQRERWLRWQRPAGFPGPRRT